MNGLVVYAEVVAVDLVVVEVGTRCDVEYAEELVLRRQLQTRAGALGHVEVGLIHQSVGAALVCDALHHVRRGAVICRHEQRMGSPGLQIVERERVAVFRCELGITERDDRGITGVLERVELTSPRAAQAARVVDLQLLRRSELIRQEHAGEQLEVVFLERNGLVLSRRLMVGEPVVAAGVHLPVLSAQTSHHPEAAQLQVGCGIERMNVHLVDEAVVVGLVFLGIAPVPRRGVFIRLLRRVFLREAPVVACLQLEVLGYLVLVVKFQLPRLAVHVERTALVAVLHGPHHVVPLRRVLIFVLCIRLPAVVVGHEIEEMLVREVVAVVQLAVIHLGFVACMRSPRHHSRRLCCPDSTIIIRCAAVAIASAEHHHAAQRQVVLARGVPREAESAEEVVAQVVALGAVVLIGIIQRIGLLAHCAALAAVVAIAHVGISVELRTVEVEVEACVGTSARVGTGLHRAVVACLAVFLQHDVDYSSRAFSRKLGRRIVYHLNAVDALGRQLLQYLRPVVGGQSAGLAVDPHLHALVAAQRYISVVVYLHRGYVLQHVAGRPSGIGYLLVHAERLAVNLQLHLRALPRHRHFLHGLRVVGHI